MTFITRGELKKELRVSKKGQEYTYHSFVCSFKLPLSYDNQGWQLRSALVFKNKNGWTIATIMIRPVESATKGFKTPTKTIRYVVKELPNGEYLFLVRNNKGKLEMKEKIKDYFTLRDLILASDPEQERGKDDFYDYFVD